MARQALNERLNIGGRASRLGDRLLITARAQKAMRRFCADAERQHLVLTWPGGANYLPAAMHHAGPYDVVVGHLARCPIYADLRQLELFRAGYMLIDLIDHSHAPRPLLKTTRHQHAATTSQMHQSNLVASAGRVATRRGHEQTARPAQSETDHHPTSSRRVDG